MRRYELGTGPAPKDAVLGISGREALGSRDVMPGSSGRARGESFRLRGGFQEEHCARAWLRGGCAGVAGGRHQ